MPCRLPKAILQHSLVRTMELTALRILLWGDDDDDSDVGFLEDLYACWSKLRSQRYMTPREHGSAGRHSACATHVLNNLIYRFSDTGFRVCFRMGRTSFWRLIHLCENIPEAATIFHQNGGVHAPTPRRCISRLQRHYISSMPVEVVPKEHAYYLTTAMVLFGSTRGGSSGSWSIL